MADEPVINESEFFHSRVIKNFAEFKQLSDVIVANRLSEDMKDVCDKVYTRDLHSRYWGYFRIIGYLLHTFDK